MTIGNHVWRFETNRLNSKGNPIFFNFRCDIETLEEVIQRLNDGKLIYGEILFTKIRADEGGEYLQIIAKKPCGVGAQAVATVAPAEKRFVEWTA